MKKTVFSLLMGTVLLAGCAPTGQDLASNVYSGNQVNTRQEVNTVRIISIIPAKVVVDNSQQRDTAQTAGALLGAVAGAVIGHQYSDSGAVAGGVAGGTLGALGASSLETKKLVEGVTLTYQTFSQPPKTYSSTQVGRSCQFQPGLATMITTKYNETRIQPNAACPIIR